MVNVLNKPLPFKGKIPSVVTDDYQQVMKSLAGSKAKSIVVDDAGYLITNYFMKNHSSKGAGNAIFSMYNTLADNFWNLIEFIKKLPADKIVYIIMHEDINDFGDIKPKTIGKMLDEKIEDARGDGNRQAKYSMMRTRAELQKALEQIKYGLTASEKAMNTAKAVLNGKQNLDYMGPDRSNNEE